MSVKMKILGNISSVLMLFTHTHTHLDLQHMVRWPFLYVLLIVFKCQVVVTFRPSLFDLVICEAVRLSDSQDLRV